MSMRNKITDYKKGPELDEEVIEAIRTNGDKPRDNSRFDIFFNAYKINKLIKG